MSVGQAVSQVLQFFAAVAWPVAVVTIALLFRPELKALLDELRELHLKAGGFETLLARERERVTSLPAARGEQGAPPREQPPIAKEVPEELRVEPRAGVLTAELATLASVSPAEAVVEAYMRVDTRLRELVLGLEVPTQLDAPALARLGVRRGVITEATARAVEGLGMLRNLAAHHGGRRVSVAQAIEYLTLVDAVLFAIDQDSRARRQEDD
jgi:hypothetical protein